MSHKTLGSLDVGEVIVDVLNVGDLKHSLVDSLDLPESAWKGRYEQLFVDWIAVPVQCALIRTEDATILVDAASQDLEPDSKLSIPGYISPPSLITQLAELGVGPGDVTHVVITHMHFDHYNGLSAMRNGEYVALYPNARVLLGQADWERVEVEANQDGGPTLAANMLQPYVRAGRIDPVDGEMELTPEVRVVLSPGETPGHLSVYVRSQGIAFWCIGDIYHHWVEVENREWMANWAARGQMMASRRALEERALAEDAMLMASHIRGVGRLVRTDDGVRWQDLMG